MDKSRVRYYIFVWILNVQTTWSLQDGPSCLQQEMDNYCQTLRVDGEGREKCGSADNQLFARYGLNKARTKSAWRCYAEFLDSSVLEGCVNEDGTRTNEQCSDPDPSAGKYCSRSPELTEIRNNGCPATMACGNNEIWTECGGCDSSCSNPFPICPAVCVAQCQCKEGHFRNDEGLCVTSNNCEPMECGVNEQYTNCNEGCGPFCDSSIVCDSLPFCAPGCECIDEYVRDRDGECVLHSDCPHECDTNEIWKECGGCDASCKNPMQYCPEICISRCECADGFFRNEKNECVESIECEQFECGTNAHWTACKDCWDVCETGESLTICAMMLWCTPACNCNEGFSFSETGECIECEKECGVNEVLGCPNRGCEPTCANQNPECEPINCFVADTCICDTEYYRDDNGKCVRIDECESTRPCGANEMWMECGGCDAMCNNPHRVCPEMCVEQCECAQGFFRNANNECVESAECEPFECENNAHWTACKGCWNVCEEGESLTICNRAGELPLNLQIASSNGLRSDTVADIMMQSCYPTCVCDEGFSSSEDGECIKCHKECRGVNEVWNECGSSCANTCEDPEPICTDDCNPTCECDSGYVYNSVGNCVLLEHCEASTQCGPHSVWNDCGSSCPATCEDLEPICTYECNPSCECEIGYVYDNNGICTLLDNHCDSHVCDGRNDKIPCVEVCTSRCIGEAGCSSHEIWNECGSSCPRTCSNPFPFCNNQCHATCECEPGYLYNDKMECVSEECQSNFCKDHQTWNECGSVCPKTCADPTPICTEQCHGTCECDDGYVYNTDMECILNEDCSSIVTPTCQENEQMACSGTCEATCSNKWPACSTIYCFLPDTCICDTEKGYYRDENGDCVLYKECENSCDSGEIEVCFSNVCEHNEASCQNPYPDCYPDISCSTETIMSKCICDQSNGFYRNSNGECVQSEECEPFECDMANQEYTHCLSGCGPFCDSNIMCDMLPYCVPGCSCASGYFEITGENNHGDCVLQSDCPDTCNKDYENWNDCGSVCPKTCANPAPICTEQCHGTCECDEGYVYNTNMECVAQSECEFETCPVNEIWNECPCEPSCTEQNPTCQPERTAIPVECTPSCVCEPPLVRQDGNCINVEECDMQSPCLENEFWTDCGPPEGCVPHCNIDDNIICPTVCIPQCMCLTAHVRDENNKCVHSSECSSPATAVAGKNLQLLNYISTLRKKLTKYDVQHVQSKRHRV